MKYRLKQPLPFLAAGMVFGKGGAWGNGWGVDLGTNTKSGAHRGVATFTDAQNEILTEVMNNADWSAWRMFNAVTEALKGTNVVDIQRKTTKLHELTDLVVELEAA